VTGHPPLVRPAQPREAAVISDLALRSKGHWGYDAAFLEACRDELAVSPAWCAAGTVLVAEDDDTPGALLGFVALTGEPPEGELAHLFVEPAAMGRGVGGLLTSAALELATSLGMTRLTLDADPHAEAFYLRMGAVRVGESPSGSIPGRVLPRMVLTVPGGTPLS
jgi:GNAT superfamily N-acetyltransferase